MTRFFIIAAVLASLVLTGIFFHTRMLDRTPDPVAAGQGQVASEEIEITSGDQTYPAYVASPGMSGRWPAVVLLHSINGLEPGYLELSNNLAAAGYVVLAIEWQTFERVPHDDSVIELVEKGIEHLTTRPNVDPERIGLTGFCIGGRYTMLLLPQIKSFKSGVAWYGFPYRGGDENQVMAPAKVLDKLSVPMLILHGTADTPSPIADIFRYAAELDEAGTYFELKVYQGQPHGFMLHDGELSDSFEARDAFQQMVSFFDRTL